MHSQIVALLLAGEMCLMLIEDHKSATYMVKSKSLSWSAHLLPMSVESKECVCVSLYFYAYTLWVR